MNNANSPLYIFNYTAINFSGKQVSDFFVAESLDDCHIVLDAIGYKNIDIVPLTNNDKKPNLNKPFDMKNISKEFSELSNSLKSGNNMFNALVATSRISTSNKNIYERLIYFVYKNNPLSVAMKKLGPVIPIDIINAVVEGETANNIPASLEKFTHQKKDTKKDSFFSKLLTAKIELPGSKKSTPEQVTSPTTQDKNNASNNGIKKREENTATKLFPYKYSAVDENGKKVTGYFDASSIEECNRFLEMQGYTNIKVEPKKKYDIEIVLDKRISVAVLAFDLTQLSTYIKAGIPLVEGVSILSKQSNSPSAKVAYQKLVYDLLKGDSLSTAMTHQGNVFPKLLTNMVKSAEVTGDLPTILDDMASYYEDMEQTRKAMKSAMTYPVMVLLIAISVLVFMLLFLVPQFVSLYESNGAELPAITKFVIAMSDFFRKDYMYIIMFLVLSISGFLFAFKKIQPFRRVVQTILMRIPSLGNIIIYNEVYNFTKTFASLLNHGVFITDSMEILSNITENEIYKEIISDTLKNLSMGNNISTAFKGKWAFPMVAYHMLVTGENTGQLGLMMEKVSNHYKQLHKSMVDQLKSIIEPIMILLVAGIVGLILLSIITPMFDIYNQIQ